MSLINSQYAQVQILTNGKIKVNNFLCRHDNREMGSIYRSTTLAASGLSPSSLANLARPVATASSSTASAEGSISRTDRTPHSRCTKTPLTTFFGILSFQNQQPNLTSMRACGIIPAMNSAHTPSAVDRPLRTHENLKRSQHPQQNKGKSIKDEPVFTPNEPSTNPQRTRNEPASNPPRTQAIINLNNTKPKTNKFALSLAGQS